MYVENLYIYKNSHGSQFRENMPHCLCLTQYVSYQSPVASTFLQITQLHSPLLRKSNCTQNMDIDGLFIQGKSLTLGTDDPDWRSSLSSSPRFDQNPGRGPSAPLPHLYPTQPLCTCGQVQTGVVSNTGA